MSHASGNSAIAERTNTHSAPTEVSLSRATTSGPRPSSARRVRRNRFSGWDLPSTPSISSSAAVVPGAGPAAQPSCGPGQRMSLREKCSSKLCVATTALPAGASGCCAGHFESAAGCRFLYETPLTGTRAAASSQSFSSSSIHTRSVTPAAKARIVPRVVWTRPKLEYAECSESAPAKFSTFLLKALGSRREPACLLGSR
jgi:hypothetical protein